MQTIIPDRLIALHLNHWYEFLLSSLSNNTTRHADNGMNTMSVSLVTSFRHLKTEGRGRTVGHWICALLHNHLYLEGLKEEPIKRDLLQGSNRSPLGQGPSVPSMTVLQVPSDTTACVQGH